MMLRAFKQSRSHSILVNRVNLVEVENVAALSVEEPGPLASRSLQRDQLAAACIGQGDGPRISCEFAVVVASNRQIGLGSEGGKSPTEAHGSVEKKAGLAMVLIAKKGKQRTGKLLIPILSARPGLSNNPRQQHSDVLRAEAPPLAFLSQKAVQLFRNLLGNVQLEFCGRP